MGWRESRQLRTTAKGYWPEAVALTSARQIALQRVAGNKPGVARLQFRQRLCGVMAACDAFVVGDARCRQCSSSPALN